jgi:amidophosphoribosyltransferase
MAVFFGSFSLNGKALADLSQGISSLADEDDVCGLAITDGKKIEVMAHSELIESRRGNLENGREIAGIGVTKSSISQPKSYTSPKHGKYAVGYDGRILNSSTLIWDLFSGDEVWDLDAEGGILSGSKDVEIVSALVEKERNLPKGISEALVKVAGNCNCIFLTPKALHIASGMPGLTRLAIGEKNGTLAVSNDPHALCNGSGFKYVCDVPPGVIMRISKDGLETVLTSSIATNSVKRCWARWIRDSNPDSLLGNIPVKRTRMWLGARLADLDKINHFPFSPSDSVVGSVPNRCEDHAFGYASFLEIPNCSLFEASANESGRSKTGEFGPVNKNIQDKKVIILDLSVSSDLPEIVKTLARSGAQEVHVRVVSPNPVRTCPFEFPGVGEELSVAPLSDLEVQRKLGATSVRFLQLPKVKDNLEEEFPLSRLCQMCMATY